MAITAHLKASSVLDAEANESSKIIARHSRKGFKILEVRLAIRFLVSVCIFSELRPSLSSLDLIILNYAVYFANPSSLNANLLDFIKQFTVSFFMAIAEKEQR